ncbi:MAG: 16S rRNA (cytidine(1402)-2'-O)-methyltransferase [Actinobacteria bacterium]|nr:16S rRNA (cytidine(1402)-2'-O)-methyltransferase [Actinomycetota bacterium]
MSGTLILCASPIGNLGDAPPRLAEALRSAAVVYAEDTRRARILLAHLGVSRPLRSYFAGNEAERSVELGRRLAAGETVALLTDAGVPTISDPGLSAVRAAVEAGAAVTGVPGPSAVTLALAVSGLPADRFTFEGFLPRRGARREQRRRALAAEPRTLVFFCAPGRLAEDLAVLAASLGEGRRCAVCRELTKVHEEIWRGTLGEAASHWAESPARGEVTLVVAGAPEGIPDLEAAAARVRELMAQGMSRPDACRKAADETGAPRRALYAAVTPRGDAPDPG